jgi:hypothetical protein
VELPCWAASAWAHPGTLICAIGPNASLKARGALAQGVDDAGWHGRSAAESEQRVGNQVRGHDDVVLLADNAKPDRRGIDEDMVDRFVLECTVASA